MNNKTRVAITSTIIKLYFFPMMAIFCLGHYYMVKNILNLFQNGLVDFGIFSSWWYILILEIIFALDTAIFAFSYLFEAKWLKNEIKSTDPYFSSWILVLVCYPPLNAYAGKLLPAYFGLGNLTSDVNYIVLFLRFLVILMFLIYTWSRFALFFKASNLTNRGVVTHGPYAYVRHPSYASKNIAWWFINLSNGISLTGSLFLVVWNLIYISRALTEERHLLRDPDYKKYVLKVKWRFIPCLF